MKKHWLVLIIPAALVLFWIGQRLWYQAFDDPRGEAYMESKSPDGRFTVSTYVQGGFHIPWIMMPGQGGAGNRPGIIVLRDQQGKTLQRTTIEMAQALDKSAVRWSADEVHIKLTATWPLPPAKTAQSDKNPS